MYTMEIDEALKIVHEIARKHYVQYGEDCLPLPSIILLLLKKLN